MPPVHLPVEPGNMRREGDCLLIEFMKVDLFQWKSKKIWRWSSLRDKTWWLECELVNQDLPYLFIRMHHKQNRVSLTLRPPLSIQPPNGWKLNASRTHRRPSTPQFCNRSTLNLVSWKTENSNQKWSSTIRCIQFVFKQHNQSLRRVNHVYIWVFPKTVVPPKHPF